MNAPARHSALPPTLAPRGLSREQAAFYIGVRRFEFDALIKSGKMPPANQSGLWDIPAIDDAFTSLFNETTKDGRQLDPNRTWAYLDRVAGVYFIGFGIYIKIGVSRSIGARLREIGLHLPEKITLFGIIRGATIREERNLHRRFASDRLRGEWFRKSPTIEAFIRDETTP